MKKVIIAILAVFATSVLCFAGSSASDQVKLQKEISRKNVDDVKSRVDKMKIEILEKNKQYRPVGITSVIKMKISEITGAKPPVSINDDAKVQSRISDRLFREYLKRACSCAATAAIPQYAADEKNGAEQDKWIRTGKKS